LTNQYTPEDVPTVLRRMFSETIKLGESWEADGNRMLSDFEHGKFITESLDEWAYHFSALADEYEERGSFPSPEYKPFYDAHMATDCDHDPAREGGCEIEANCAFCGVEHYPTFHDEVQAIKLHVVSVEAQHTGGGCIATLHTLSDGRILIGSNTDESYQMCSNRKLWDEGGYEDAGQMFQDLPTALVELGIEVK
jgi:hypothetical protein